MPALTQSLNSPLLRTLVYGDAKTKKTWWGLMGAEYFNTILIDGDKGSSIATNIPNDIVKNVYQILLEDTAIMEFSALCFSKKESFIWDEKNQRKVLTVTSGCTRIQPSKLTSNDLIIIDSWTSLVQSIYYSYESQNKVEVTQANKDNKPSFNAYGFANRVSNHLLEKLLQLPCHVIVIAHANLVEKRDDNGNIISSKTVPLGATVPSSLSMAKYFNDVLYFYTREHPIYKISTQGKVNRIGGSRVLAPKEYDWTALQFKDVCQAYKIPLIKKQSFNSEFIKCI